VSGRRRKAVLERGLPHPVAALEGHVVGLCYASQFRLRDGYRYTVEDSIYVRPDCTGHRVGSTLLAQLILDCQLEGCHSMIACICGENVPSVPLHTSLGFQQVGLLPEAGRKFGEWLPLRLMQRQLRKGSPLITGYPIGLQFPESNRTKKTAREIMLESEMEDLIASHPNEFFPRNQLTLKGRQGCFGESGRYDLLFADEFSTKIVMELKAVPAKYEHATQLARYKDALRMGGHGNVLMWLVAPSIPRAVRDFLDEIGIEYTEIHEAEIRRVAARHGYALDGPMVGSVQEANPAAKSPSHVPTRSNGNRLGHGDGAWFFNTDEGETEGIGAYVKMIDQSCVALWNFANPRSPEAELSRPASGDRVFFYLNKVGFIATGLFTDEAPTSNDLVFRPKTPGAFSRQVSDLITVSHDKAVKQAEVLGMGYNIRCIKALYRIPDERREVMGKVLGELKIRSQAGA
jgi:phosphinothricin acetyltransferase